MKKIIVLTLMTALLVSLPLFAGNLNGFKVGGQMGFGSYSINAVNRNSEYVMHNGGFYLAATGEYPVKEYNGHKISAKGAIGINTMGRISLEVTAGGQTMKDRDTKASPANFVLYGGAEYGIDINEDIGLQLGAGINMLIGRIFAEGDESTNAAIGLAMEAVGAYNLQDNIDIIAGIQAGWQFINTSDMFGEMTRNTKINGTSFKIFAGATYAL